MRISCLLSGFVEFCSAVLEEKPKMSQSIRGQGNHHALSKPPLRRQCPDLRPIWLLVGAHSAILKTWACFQMGGAQPALFWILYIYIVSNYRYCKTKPSDLFKLLAPNKNHPRYLWKCQHAMCIRQGQSVNMKSWFWYWPRSWFFLFRCILKGILTKPGS